MKVKGNIIKARILFVTERLDAAIVKVVGGGKTQVFEEIGRASAKANLSGVHKGMLVPGDPDAFMKKADMFYRFYYDTGHREYESTGPKSGILTTKDAESDTAADALRCHCHYLCRGLPVPEPNRSSTQ